MNKEKTSLFIRGVRYTKQVLLDDVNIPYKLTCLKNHDILFFCINTDEFSDQSFSVVHMDLGSRKTVIIPGIRNGFATAVDQESGAVYIGASNGVWEYDHVKKTVKTTPISNVDILDMFHFNRLYFVKTASQNLYEYDGSQERIVTNVRNYRMEHFIFDGNSNLYFVNSAGLFRSSRGTKTPVLFEDSAMNFRGAAVDMNGDPFFISDTGIHLIDKENERLHRIAQINNGYGLAFDYNDNIIYSDERTLNKLIRES